MGTQCSVWSLLPTLGFVPHPKVISKIRPGLRCDFGNLRLDASAGVNRHLNDVVLFTGIVSTPRTGVLLEFEVPRQVASREQALAFVAYFLDRHADGGVFVPETPARWLDEGRMHRSLLPWEQTVADASERACCTVARDWLRLALKQLKASLATLPLNASVAFGFDGECLVIRGPGGSIRVQAKGEPWPAEFVIPVAKLTSLPSRLRRDPVPVALRRDAIVIGGRVIRADVTSDSLV